MARFCDCINEVESMKGKLNNGLYIHSLEFCLSANVR